MPLGYLISVTIVAWATGCALWPVGRVGFAFGFLVNEQPFYPAYWVLASTLLALADGDVHSTPGWVVVALAGLTVVGLAVVARRALRTGPRPPWLPLGRILVAPWLMSRPDVQRVSDIAYSPTGLRLDLYRHRGNTTAGPVLIHLHGGGFHRGTKRRDARPLMYRLASQGWVCVSANYRLQPAVRLADQLADVQELVEWVRRHGAGYGADPTTIVIAGSSAGAHLAACTALRDSSITAVVAMYGYYGVVDGVGPADLIGPAAPPFLVIHGDHDTFVPVEHARAFVQRLPRVEYLELPYGQHSFALYHSLRFDIVVAAIEAFADRVRRPA